MSLLKCIKKSNICRTLKLFKNTHYFEVGKHFQTNIYLDNEISLLQRILLLLKKCVCDV